MRTKFFFLALAIFLVTGLMAGLTVLAQTTQDKQVTTTSQSQPVDSDDELRRAIESSGGSETQIVTNLEGYLKKYPKSEHRQEIEGEIYKIVIKLRDRDRAISYAQKLIEANESNIDALTNLVTMLRERKGDGDLNVAITYANQLVRQFEGIVVSSPKPKRISAAQWEERKQQGLASVYLVRGRVHSDLGNDDKAKADAMKSFDAAQMAGAVLLLGELAEKRKAVDEAIGYYTQGFVIALVTNEEIGLKSVRQKLGQLYASKNGSEAGLGDRLLKAYDSFVKDRDERLAKLEMPNINEGATSALGYKLTRLDGSKLDLASLRGKVIVFNFWATWCGPCLTEMPLFEKTIGKYKEDKDVVFLAVTTDEDRELVAPFLKQHKFNLPIVYAEYLNDFFSVSSIPTTIILDRKGEVTFRQAGYNPRADFVSELSGRIEEAKKK
ncbi:MAG: redoxin family protein [Acidobacteria bacterium]|nr:redoxin family protein [Acidobacteriota bacterium]